MKLTKRKSSISGLYAIVDSKWNASLPLPDLAKKYLEGGCRLIQLRMKGGERCDILKTAREIAKLKEKYNFAFIMNDYADIACEVGADGVHVGENDTPIEEIKKSFGRDLIVGYSSHSLDEAVSAADKGADYVAFGAIFPTRTKGPGHPVQGIDRLKDLVSKIKIPLVAIGGIGRENIDQVLKTKVDSVAMISALSTANDIVQETAWFVDVIQRS